MSSVLFPSRTLLAYARPTREGLTIKLLNELHAAGAQVPGFAYSITNGVPANVAKQVGTLASGVRTRLLLPDLDVLPERPPTQPRFAFAKRVPPLTATGRQASRWLGEVMDVQDNYGATAYVTPSPLVGNNHGELELRRVMEWADTARSLAKGGMPVITGLTVGRDWLAKAEKREILLNALTDAADPAFHLVVHWPAMGSYSQLSDLDALRGHREVAEVLEGEGRELIAGRVGLAGWMLAACGASAYSTGIYPSHIYKDNPKIRRAKGSKSPPRIPHYLDGRVLSYVPQGRLAAVSRISGPPGCRCPDCQVLLGSGYDDNSAFRHLLRLHARLTSELAAHSNPIIHVRTQVGRAISLIANHPLQLPAAVISHLAVWRDALS